MPSRKDTKKLRRNAPRPPVATIGVLADTHVPDRVSDLHPLVIPTFIEKGVTHILHAGDICSPRVLVQLKEVAPVTAVRGNRDWFVPGIPLVSKIEISGVRMVLMHGHGGWIRYLLDKVKFLFHGYHLQRYLSLLEQTDPDAQIVVFGHTHFPEALWYKEKLLFNPGSAGFGSKKGKSPSIGLIRISADQKFTATIHPLKGYQIYKRKWVKKMGQLPSK